GAHEDGQTLETFAKQVIPEHVRTLINWRPFEGYQFALLLAAQPTLSSVVIEANIDPDIFSQIIDWASTKGDLMSHTAVFEAGLLRSNANPNLHSELAALVKTIIADGEEPLTRYNLHSALIMAVYGEIAQTRVLASKPPFWRKLAAIAHASLIE